MVCANIDLPLMRRPFFCLVTVTPPPCAVLSRGGGFTTPASFLPDAAPIERSVGTKLTTQSGNDAALECGNSPERERERERERIQGTRRLKAGDWPDAKRDL